MRKRSKWRFYIPLWLMIGLVSVTWLVGLIANQPSDMMAAVSCALALISALASELKEVFKRKEGEAEPETEPAQPDKQIPGWRKLPKKKPQASMPKLLSSEEKMDEEWDRLERMQANRWILWSTVLMLGIFFMILGLMVRNRETIEWYRVVSLVLINLVPWLIGLWPLWWKMPEDEVELHRLIARRKEKEPWAPYWDSIFPGTGKWASLKNLLLVFVAPPQFGVSIFVMGHWTSGTLSTICHFTGAGILIPYTCVTFLWILIEDNKKK